SHLDTNDLWFDKNGNAWFKTSVGKEHTIEPDQRFIPNNESKKNVKIRMNTSDNNKYQLGKGGFGRVCLAQDTENGNWYAVKIPHDDTSDKNVKEEIENLQQQGSFAFYDPESRMIFMKLINGTDLSVFIGNKKNAKTYDQITL